MKDVRTEGKYGLEQRKRNVLLPSTMTERETMLPKKTRVEN